MKEKIKIIFVKDKKLQIVGGIVGLVMIVLLFVMALCLTRWDEEELWAIIFMAAIFTLFFVWAILSIANGIYVFPNGKVLCILSLKMRLFKLDKIDNVAIEFHQQFNNKYLANITVTYLDGRTFNQNYVKQANDITARSNGASGMVFINEEQVKAVYEELKNQDKFSVSIETMYN